MIFREIIVVYSENHTKHIGKNAEVFNILILKQMACMVTRLSWKLLLRTTRFYASSALGTLFRGTKLLLWTGYPVNA
jgi:hypothetical protein